MATAPPPRSWQQAQEALARRDMAAAERHLQALLREAPGQVGARVLLAGVLLSTGRLRAARAQLLHAAATLPDDPASICRVAQALLRVGESVATRDCLAHPALAGCHDGPTLASLAHLEQSLGRHREALALMDRARVAGMDGADFRYFRAVELQFNGQLDAARDELHACLRQGRAHGRAWLTLARLPGPQGAVDPAPEAIVDARQQAAAGSEDAAALDFALYTVLERHGDHDAAWTALVRGNATMHARLKHSPATEAALYDAIIATCDGDLLVPAAAADATAPGDATTDLPRPVFIVGLPRSGTTVLDRILGNHSRVVSAGELGDFGHQLRQAVDVPGRTLLDHAMLARLPAADLEAVGRGYLAQVAWRAGGARCIVDKLPANFMVAGLVARALPQAVILHMVRDPADVGFSNYRAMFGDAYPYSYDPDALVAHHHQYLRLMAHWHATLPGRILDVGYEELVAAPDRLASRIFAACGLADEAGCSDLSRNTAPSATLSSVQVRQPIHARGIGEWRAYARHWKPVARRLRETGAATTFQVASPFRR